MTTRLGLLHTGAVHVGAFERLLAEEHPTAVGAHRVDESLLADARSLGADHQRVAEQVERQLRGVAEDVGAVLCTCSTIGAVAESMSGRIGVPIVRIDRPMAAAAVARGDRIGIVAAVASTLGPTRALLDEEADAARRSVTLVDLVCPEAWANFEAGDGEGYLDLLAAHVDRVAASVDVIVLAQASMAGAATRCTTATPVLTSPSTGLAAAIAAARAAGDTRPASR